MSQIPPQPPSGADAPAPPFPRPKSNVFAILSLVFGCLGCIPLLGGVLAVVFGMLGIRDANRDPWHSGKGLAIAGLVLGTISLGLWLLFGGSIGWVVVKSRPAAQLTRTFITDLSTGNVSAANANADPSTLPPAQVTALSQQVQAWGSVSDVSVWSRNWVNGQWTLAGTVQFSGSGGTKAFTAKVVNVNGVAKVSEMRFQ